MSPSANISTIINATMPEGAEKGAERGKPGPRDPMVSEKYGIKRRVCKKQRGRYERGRESKIEGREKTQLCQGDG